MATIDDILAGEGAGGFQDDVIATSGEEGSPDPVRKEVANYRPAEDPAQSCGTCKYFVAPEGCTRVLGQISESGVSDLWEPAETESLLEDGMEDFLYGGAGAQGAGGAE